jgi:hypothetical protein
MGFKTNPDAARPSDIRHFVQHVFHEDKVFLLGRPNGLRTIVSVYDGCPAFSGETYSLSQIVCTNVWLTQRAVCG